MDDRDAVGHVRASLLTALDGTLRALRTPLDDAAVHRVRKDLRRARALARLLRPALGDRAFAAANGALRDAGRDLAGVRDARVLVSALDALVERAGLDRRPLAPLATTLAREFDAARGAAPADGSPVAVRRRVQAARRGLAGAQARGGWKVVGEGLAAIHRRGRRAMRAAAATPTPGGLHEWRKQVKNLRHALEPFEPAWPRALEPLGREAHRLSDRLGEDHDLALLRERVGVLDAADAAPLLAALDERRAALRAAAFRIGARLYAERPRRFAARLVAYARRAQAGSERSGQTFPPVSRNSARVRASGSPARV